MPRTPNDQETLFCVVAAGDVSDKVPRNEDERTIGPLEQYCIKPMQGPELNRVPSAA